MVNENIFWYLVIFNISVICICRKMYELNMTSGSGAGHMGSRTDLGLESGETMFFFWGGGDRMVRGVSGLNPKMRFNLARTPVILYFTELKNSISIF